MNRKQRPWWLIVNKSTGLVTTIEDEWQAGERVFTIRGERLVQGLGWLTWGPVAALLMVMVLAWLAVAFNIREQSGPIRAMFVAGFLGLPALAWGLVTVIATRLSEKYLQAERQAGRQESVIRLNQKAGTLAYQLAPDSAETVVPYAHIRQVKVAYPIGGKENKVPRLSLETNDTSITLLKEALGTRAQKAELAGEIQESVKRYVEGENLSASV